MYLLRIATLRIYLSWYIQKNSGSHKTVHHGSRVYGYISWYIQWHYGKWYYCARASETPKRTWAFIPQAFPLAYLLHYKHLTHLCCVVRGQSILWHVLRRWCASMALCSVTTSMVWNRYGHPYRSVKKLSIWTIITTLQTVGNTVSCW